MNVPGSPSRYALDREIGRGEMGTVYLARDPRLDRPLAIKIYAVPSGISREQIDEFRTRFLREAKAAASLSHPGIVTVHDAGDENGIPFIVMEFVDGETLKQRIQRRGSLDPKAAYSIASAIADALQAAHEKGIVHRDIKPANILLRTEDGRVKIADFGVARLPGSELTRFGAALGSPAYMSPEQIDGSAARPESDLFSLAVILYECLCGQRPFSGETLSALTWAIRHDSPEPVARHLDACPPALQAFFDRALAKDPSARFRTGAEFRAALEEATTVPREKTEQRRTRVRTFEIVALAGLLVIGLLLIVRGIDDLGGSTLPEATPSRPPAVMGSRSPGGGALKASSAGVRPAMHGWLSLRVKSDVAAGTMVLSVDRDIVYTHRLAATRKTGFTLARKRENFEARVRVPAGRHNVTAQVRPTGKAAYERSIPMEMRAGQTRKLEIVVGRAFGAPLSLKAD